MEKLNRLLFLISFCLLSQLLVAQSDEMIHISNISPYQLFQRDESGKADIYIQGQYSGSNAGIEARWNNSEVWTNLSKDSASQGTFSGTLSNQDQGQGLLEVRFSDHIEVHTSVPYVGIGDIFVVAGQSNASGRGTALNVAFNEHLKATLFANDDHWKELQDPVDLGTGQIDQVSKDYNAGGSPWPLLATQIMESEGIPLAFIPVAKGSTNILEWQPQEDHADASSLYGSMYRRIQAAGGKVKAVLFFQGEEDAGNETSQSEYELLLNTLINTIEADFPGLKTMIGQIGHSNRSGLNDIRTAQLVVMNVNPNALPGPFTYDIDLGDEGGDELHFVSDADMKEFARRWYKAIEKAFYKGNNGCGPLVSKAKISYDPTFNKITVPFKSSTKPAISAESSVSPNSFRIKNDGIVPVSSVTILENTIELTPVTQLDIQETIILNYARGNTGVNSAIYDNEGLPAEIFQTLVFVDELDNSGSAKPHFSIYPNPTASTSTINIAFNAQIKVYTASLYNVSKKIVFSSCPTLVDNTLTLNFTGIESGVYLIQLDTETGPLYDKIIVI